MKKKTWRRRNFFIKKDLQGKYIFAFFLFVVGGSIIFTLILSMLSANTLTITYNDYDLQIGQTPFMLLREILSAHWIFILTAGIAVVIVAIFITHRFAGPMFRFEKSVEEMLKGNFAFQIHLRKKDEGKELAEKLNQLIDMISSRVNEMRGLNDKIGDCLAKAGQSNDQTKEHTGTPDSVREARALNQKLVEILSQFKIKNDE
jgi:methyl-accepting chemotaxis protein